MNKQHSHKIYSLGENALTVDFGNNISVDLNNKVHALADIIEATSFKGFIECVPAYSSLTIFYDLTLVRRSHPEFKTAFLFVNQFIDKALENVNKKTEKESRLIEIPINFDKDSALDLGFVAKTNHISNEKVIEIFLSRIYQVFMVGFLPGFAYMGSVDKSIATPRKQTPRTKVPKGSVGIAGTQTGIYPLESPGGWQIIGRTNSELFTPNEKPPTLFQAGDSVKFIKE